MGSFHCSLIWTACSECCCQCFDIPTKENAPSVSKATFSRRGREPLWSLKNAPHPISVTLGHLCASPVTLGCYDSQHASPSVSDTHPGEWGWEVHHSILSIPAVSVLQALCRTTPFPAQAPRPPCPVQIIKTSRHLQAVYLITLLDVQTWWKPLTSTGKPAFWIFLSDQCPDTGPMQS